MAQIKYPTSPQLGVKYEPGMRVLPEANTGRLPLSSLNRSISNDQINEHRRNLSKKYHGSNSPVYQTAATPEQIRQSNMAMIRNNMANDPAYGARRNDPVEELKPNFDESIDDLLQEARSNKPLNTEKKELEKTYADNKEALDVIQKQLNGLTPLSLTEAYYEVEKAFGNPYLSKDQYYSVIEESKAFISQWMDQNNLDKKNPEAVHYVIQKFIGSKLTIKIRKGTEDVIETTKTHFPFFYDFDDYKGEKDHRNFFVTKAFATGSGQCNSLPAVYLILAEQLGVQAYLSFVPHHALIMYRGNDGSWNNYEVTASTKLSSKWYKEWLHIKTTAIQSGIYLKPLNKREVVANLAIDLANGYVRKNGLYDIRLINDCIKTAENEFPRNDNLYVHLMKNFKLSLMLEMEMDEQNIKDKDHIPKGSDADKFYKLLTDNEQLIFNLGYHKLPENIYNDLMDEHKENKIKQNDLRLNGKKTRNLFTDGFN